MKPHYIFALGTCAMALTVLPLAAHADPPPAGAGAGKPAKPDANPGRKPGDLFGKPSASAAAHADKGHDDNKGEHGKPGEAGKPDEAGKPGEAGKPPGRPGEGFRGAMRQLREDLKAGKVKKEELKDKLAKLHESAGERGKEHRHELGKRWNGALAMPAAREELKHHARRMAFLNRALVLAQTEAKDKDKDKLLERITKLIDKEDERHERAMERFKSMPPAGASASAAPAASAAPTPAGSAEGAAK
jgi:hypothetical protein